MKEVIYVSLDIQRLKDKYGNLTRRYAKEEYINIQPIQRGGLLTPEAKRVLLEFGDGYSVCDYCTKGKLVNIKKPPIVDFLADVATFMGMDVVRPTAGSRMAQYVIFNVMTEKGDTVILDSTAHYTTYLAIDEAKLHHKEVPNNGYPEFKINEDDYATKIEEVKKETGTLPTLVFVTHVDYSCGNIVNVKKISKICQDYGVPLVLNGAYSVGIMPVNGKELGVDFLTASGHKSMAASGPIGLLGMQEKHSEKILEAASIKGEWSGRQFLNKESHFYGCPPVYGLPIITLMASFPRVVERSQPEAWKEEVKKVKYFVQEIERIESVKVLGKRPKEHPLIQIETPAFYEVSKTHKRKGYFLSESLRKKKVVGVFPGSSKRFKINIHGLSWEKLNAVISAFQEIARENNIPIN
ncbi:MAG: O-phospho-L-seryl-tRNA:Cys-tRNA synthase [Candidatus Helarchaeota archaeon]